MAISGEDNPVLVIDLGGAKIILALVSSQGEVIAKEYIATLAEEGPEVVVQRMFAAQSYLLDRVGRQCSSVAALTIAAAGAIDSEEGVVTDSPNLPGWYNVPLRDIGEERTGLRTLLINDANAAAWGEHCFGAGRGVANLIYIAVGTGIGGGIIINGELYTGASGSAGEIGHMTIDVNGPRCNCGNVGCLEVLASGGAMAKEARRHIAHGARSILTELAEGEPQNITFQLVSAAARRGDALAAEVISRAAAYLGIGIVNLVNIFNPEMIIIGGGMVQMRDMFLDPVRQAVAEKAFQSPGRIVRIIPSELEDNAGILGAAAFSFSALSSEGNWRW